MHLRPVMFVVSEVQTNLGTETPALFPDDGVILRQVGDDVVIGMR